MKMPELETIEFESDKGVAVIRLARPNSGNAINLALAQDLATAARTCAEDSAIKGVLLTGSGAMFCVGGDLKAFSASGEDVSNLVRQVAEKLHDAIWYFRQMGAPIVIAVNGTAAGAGFSLTMAGDIVLAARSAKFTMAYTAAGLTPDGGASFFLPRLVGLRRAQELIHTNRILDASQAKDWGLVTDIVDDHQLEATALATVRRLACGSGFAHSAAKALLNRSVASSLETQLALEEEKVALAAGSPDGREGISAFLEKRRPSFG